MGKEKMLFQIDEAAAFIGLSRSRIYELAKAGKIEVGKLMGRSVIRREALEAFVEENYRPQ